MYNAIRAQHAIDFIQQLKHTKGEWSGKPFILLKWQRVLVKKLFGTIDEFGYRIYRECYTEIPKKNGKTELAAAIALYLLFGDDEPGAEVYSAACDREQAGLVYMVAAEMVAENQALFKRSNVMDYRKRIVFYSTGSFYQVLSADVKTKHGFNTHGIVFDEVHAQPNRDLWNVLTKGSTLARRQPLIFAITTAGYDRNSICWELHDRAIKIKNRIYEDKHFLSMIYGLDEKTDWKDKNNWQKVNPSLGTKIEVEAGKEVIEKVIELKKAKKEITDLSKEDLKTLNNLKIINIERLQEEYDKAITTPANINQFRRLHLNQWTSQETRWMEIEKWDESDGKVEPEELKGKICYGGLDLSSSIDLTAFVLIFPVDDKYKVLPFFFIPQDNMEQRIKRDGVPYDLWVSQGYITATPGNVIDYSFIENKIYECAKKYEVEEIAYDPCGATMLTQRLADNGLTMLEVHQGINSMTTPTKQLETLILQKKIHHGGNPVLRWNMDNVMIRQNYEGYIKPDREKSKEKIDGIVALILAVSRAMVNINRSLGRGAILI